MKRELDSRSLMSERKLNEKCVKDMLEFIVLRALSSKPSCGYRIMEHINKKHNVLLSPGSVYPLLQSMERDMLIEHVTTERKKIFKPTQEGIETLNRLYDKYMKILAVNRPAECEIA